MIVQPGTSSPSVLDTSTLMVLNGKRYVEIRFQDDEGNLIDIDESMTPSGTARGELELSVTNSASTEVFSESYYPNINPSTRRIERVSTGIYKIQFGVNTGETDTSGPLLFNWHVRQNETSNDVYRTQLVEVVSPRVLSLLPRFRLILDKSLKVVCQEEYMNLGYTDSNLIMYLNMGLSYLNTRQPTITWGSLDSFPIEHGIDVLIKASLLSALMSQTLLSVDTDVPSYSDQGHSFVLTHFTPLKSVRDGLVAELEKQAREFKLMYVRSGRLGAELRFGMGFYQMLNAAPPGALFRNQFSSI